MILRNGSLTPPSFKIMNNLKHTEKVKKLYSVYFYTTNLDSTVITISHIYYICLSTFCLLNEQYENQ